MACEIRTHKTRNDDYAREGLLDHLAKVNLLVCELCLAGKAYPKLFGKVKQVTHPLELVHSIYDDL